MSQYRSKAKLVSSKLRKDRSEMNGSSSEYLNIEAKQISSKLQKDRSEMNQGEMREEEREGLGGRRRETRMGEEREGEREERK
jgi:hypothetical protein